MPDCSSIAVVPAALDRRLEELRAGGRSDDEWPCDFDADHPGDEHWTIAAHGGADRKSEDVWMWWRDGEEAVLIERPSCESDAPSGDESWTPICFWVENHPGLHSSGDERW